jgi:hypothetical protein
MRRRRYIRFDFTQALHTRATSAERHDYRIIARARASVLSSTRAFARSVRLGGNEALVRMRSIRSITRTNANSSRFAHIFSAPPRIAAIVRRQFSALAELVSGAQEKRGKPGHWPRRTYQIETTRMLIAIEFFLAVDIAFLSTRRCDLGVRHSKRGETQVIRERFDSSVRRRVVS